MKGGGLILHVCQYVFQNHLKSRKYTCWLRRYNYTHDQLNTRHYIMIFLGFFLRGGGRKIKVCPRALDTLATPLESTQDNDQEIIIKDNDNDN